MERDTHSASLLYPSHQLPVLARTRRHLANRFGKADRVDPRAAPAGERLWKLPRRSMASCSHGWP